MRAAARVATALELLEGWELFPTRPFDRYAHAALAERRYAGSKDRLAILDLAFAVFRLRGAIDEAVRARGAEPTPRLRLFAALDADGRAALEEPGPYGPAPLSTHERALLAALPSPSALRGTGSGMPAWLRAAIPAEDQPGLEDEAPIDLRVAPRLGREVVALTTPQATRSLLSPWGLRLPPRAGRVEAVQEGDAEVQDEGSQLVAWLTLPVEGLDVLDRCAGAGGKTLALADAGPPRRLVAADVSADRLRGLEERLQRRARRVERVVAPPGDPWLAAQRFDVVLVDAPCSGTGTLRRAPDLAWRLRPEEVERFTQTQDAVLHEAAACVRPGGRLVYATCSVLPAENAERALAFLARHPHFEAEAIEGLPPRTRCDVGVQLSPGRSDTDGFYIARFRRRH